MYYTLATFDAFRVIRFFFLLSVSVPRKKKKKKKKLLAVLSGGEMDGHYDGISRHLVRQYTQMYKKWPMADHYF